MIFWFELTYESKWITKDHQSNTDGVKTKCIVKPIASEMKPMLGIHLSPNGAQNSIDAMFLVMADESDNKCHGSAEPIIFDTPKAFKQLFDLYYKELYCYARKYVHSGDTCKDIIQDVFLNLWERRGEVAIHESVKAYLYRAVFNRCVNHLKKADMDLRHLNNLHLQNNLEYVRGEDLYHALQEKEMMEILDSAIDQLPGQCRKIFMLSRKDGLRHKEIASRLAISPKTVEVQIYRALKFIKQQFVLNDKTNLQ